MPDFAVLTPTPLPGPGVPVPGAPPPAPARWFPRAISLTERRLLALLLTLFLLRDLPWRLDDFDQAKQAFTSLEMIEGNAWWFQHTPGSRGLATKPPLVGWMSAAVYELTGGQWEIAWRLPSLVAVVALTLLLWRAGESLWPGSGGTLAAAAFGFNLLTPRLATLVRTDAVLTLWIAGLGLMVWRHVRTGAPPWTPRARWTVFALMLATMMTKGPVVYAFLLPGMAAATWAARRHGEPMGKIWGGWWHWTLPLLPFLLWLERGIVTVPGFYGEVIAHEFLGRFTVGEAAVHHNQPVWFYVTQLLARWLPWSVLLVVIGVRTERAVWAGLWREPGTRWLLCWAAGGLLAFSLVPSKRTDRVFPVVPPLCLVLTAALAAAQRHEETTPALVQTPPDARWPRRWGHWAVLGSAALTTAATLGPVADAYWHRAAAGAAFGARVLAAAGERPCELVVGKGWTAEDESMLLYLRRLRFLRPADAVQMAGTGKLDVMVINEDALALARNRDLLTPYFSPRPEQVSGGAPPHFLMLAKPAPTPPQTPGRAVPTPTPKHPASHAGHH